MLHRRGLYTLLISLSLYSCRGTLSSQEETLDPIDYVEPNMGGISHLLVPTYPTIHLPNSMMRIHPQRADYASEQIAGLPLILTSHRGVSAFALSPRSSVTDSIPTVTHYSYDAEVVRAY